MYIFLLVFVIFNVQLWFSLEFFINKVDDNDYDIKLHELFEMEEPRQSIDMH